MNTAEENQRGIATLGVIGLRLRREWVTNPARAIPFDLRDTCALKTIGILAIVLHNYYHSLPGAVLENEFGFAAGHFQRFLALVVVPQQTFQTLFSYLGHFGVQLFIFLSAYGLGLKYWETPSWRGFVWSRIRKLYPMFFLAVALWLLLRVIEYGSGFPAFLEDQLDPLVLTTLGVINLIPGYGLPPVGPWWFLPFIVQFYCLWPALAALSRRAGPAGLIMLSAVAMGVTIVAGPTLAYKWAIYQVKTPIGHLPELCLGIATARYGARLGPVTALVALAIFLLGNLHAAFWPLTFVCALILLLYAYQSTASVWRRANFIEPIAKISMPLFFVNGFLRSPFRRVAIHFDQWYVTLVAGLGFTVFSVAVAYGMLWLERKIFARRPRSRESPEPAGP
jgi:peptidoglycan/LPS O-acetylase OafA/YrhL